MAAVAGSLDANVLLRLLLNDIAGQNKAVIKLIQDSKSQFAVADIAIIEVTFVLDRYYKFTRSQIVEALDGLASLAMINCNRELLEKALPLFIKHPSLSFEDCCLATYAELNQARPLYTFDKKLAHQIEHCKLLK
jgi:predicted nucleic-acid-binding protein